MSDATPARATPADSTEQTKWGRSGATAPARRRCAALCGAGPAKEDAWPHGRPAEVARRRDGVHQPAAGETAGRAERAPSLADEASKVKAAVALAPSAMSCRQSCSGGA